MNNAQIELKTELEKIPGIVTDLDHWAEMGVFTVADLDAYFDDEIEKEERKARYS